MQISAAMLSLVFGQPRGKQGKGFWGVGSRKDCDFTFQSRPVNTDCPSKRTSSCCAKSV